VLRGKRADQGTILIVTLWIVSILALFAVGLGYRMGLLLKTAGYRRDVKVVRQFALAGLSWSRAQLVQDTNNYDNLYECGVVLDEEEHEKFFKSVPVAKGYFTVSYQDTSSNARVTRYGFQDEERKININWAPFEMLEQLPGVDSELASAIIDWRDLNQNPYLDDQNQEKPFGAEDEAYEGRGYSCKDSMFQVVEELQLVVGMTYEIYQQVFPLVTVYGRGKVNINTASEEVLKMVARTSFKKIGGIERNADHLTEIFLDHRNGLDDEEGTDDDEPFQNMALTVNQLLLGTEERRLAFHMIENYLISESHIFRVEVWGGLSSPERHYRVEVVIERPNESESEWVIHHWREG
jgi:type II secretory pathway component PulK